MVPELELDFQPLWQGAMPTDAQFYSWAQTALTAACEAKNIRDSSKSLCIRIIDAKAMQVLNERYRGQSRPTNVLSFESSAPPGLPPEIAATLLGDVVLCGPLVLSEADDLHKASEAHWALLTVHGLLHLLGYDHQSTEDWRCMTAMESDILMSLDMPDPWQFELEA